MIGLAAMVYEPLYHGQEKATIKLFLQSEISKIQQYFLIVFNKTIIPLALVGYEMIIANSALRAIQDYYMLNRNDPMYIPSIASTRERTRTKHVFT